MSNPNSVLFPPHPGLTATTRGNFENEDYVFFWSGPFSNWDKSEFYMETNTEYGVMTFNCSEQAMMFYKAILFGDHESIPKIMKAKDPREQKRLGRLVKGFDQAEWEAACVPLITEVLKNKFTQNDDYLEVLIKTGRKKIVEASPFDEVWGIKMGVNHPDILDESKWQGKNLLGICLMNTRDWLTRTE